METFGSLISPQIVIVTGWKAGGQNGPERTLSPALPSGRTIEVPGKSRRAVIWLRTRTVTSDVPSKTTVCSLEMSASRVKVDLTTVVIWASMNQLMIGCPG